MKGLKDASFEDTNQSKILFISALLVIDTNMILPKRKHQREVAVLQS
jgi:hypothetical protein